MVQVREKKSGRRKIFQVREKSGKFNFSHGNLEKNDKSQGFESKKVNS